MTAVRVASMTTEAPPLLLAPRRRPVGPRVGALLRRTAVGTGACWLVGLVPALLGWGDAATAFGLGLWFPGAGFLYASDVPLLVLTLVLFGLAFALWFGTGNVLAPLLVWLGAAGGAAVRAGTGPWEWAEWGVPVGTLVVVGLGFALREREFRRALRRVEARNAYLATTPPVRCPSPGERAPREASEQDLAFVRYALDLALQPVDHFEGYQFLDQFQTASVRYQINFTQYALAFYQSSCAPAFRGYLALAQRRSIERMLQPRVWRYWRLENLWGNLDPNPDPIRRDNIMLSGYLGLMVGLYESGNADDRFSRPGALTFRDGKRAHEYDFGSLCAALADNFRRSHLGQFACEPNWVYSACNTTGFNTLVLHDRLHGTSYAEELYDSYRRSLLEEFTTVDGRITAIRSSRLGFTIPSLTSPMADAGTLFWLTPTVADLANRTWAILRRELLERDEEGRPHPQLRGWDRIDVGSYRPSDVSAHIMCMAAAREMGDDELADELQAVIDARFRPTTVDGVARYEDASTFSNMAALVARFNRLGGWAQNVAEGPDPRVLVGPHLAEAAYPDVLVARADTDGTDLDLVLRPGAGPRRTSVGVAGLRPGATYAVDGGTEAAVTADADGRAQVALDLDGRTELRLRPRR